MLFYKLLFFASTFYFVYPRPEGEPTVPYDPMTPDSSYSNSTDGKNPSASLSQDSDSYDEQIKKCVNAISEDINPVLSHLKAEKQKELKEMFMNEAIGLLNYLELMASAYEHRSSEKPGHFDDNDIMIEFDSTEPYDGRSHYLEAYQK